MAEGPAGEFITRLGSAGDGLADGVAIARTLPGETVRADIVIPGKRARLAAILQASSERVQAPCPHFNDLCGGCALQHWADEPYAAWKRGLVVSALERAGFAQPAVSVLHRTPAFARRRMDFATERVDGGVRLGLHEAHAVRVVDFHACHVLHPALFRLVAPLRLVLRGLAALRRQGSVIANLLEDGADLLIRTDGPLEATDRVKLASFAAAHDVRRVAWARGDGPPETAAMQGAPHAVFGGIRVEPPAGAFLQASREGEAAIVAAVLAAVPDRLTGRSKAIELYAGCGTISFPLASRLRVQAFEGDAAAAACVRRAQSSARVSMVQRDLARQPLSAKEMAGAAMVVLDPPYGGSAAQVPQIVAGRVPRVVYVSCNPGALAKDGAVLAQGGYRLLGATAIDPFLWSAQVECVAVFAL